MTLGKRMQEKNLSFQNSNSSMQREQPVLYPIKETNFQRSADTFMQDYEDKENQRRGNSSRDANRNPQEWGRQGPRRGRFGGQDSREICNMLFRYLTKV